MKFKIYLVVIFFQIIGIFSEHKIQKNNENNNDKSLSKRGIFHYGSGLPGAYASYSGYHQIPAATAPFVKYPFAYKSPGIIGAPAATIFGAPYTLGHGGAVVTSHNVNYPQFPYHPIIKSHPQLVNPSLINPFHTVPILPPAHVHPQPAPIIPFNPFSTNNYAINQRPFIHVPIAQKPIITSLNLPVPLGPFPIGYPTQSIPATIPTPTVPTATNFIPSQSWRPVVVNQQPPTTIATPSSHRPAITLLPPFGHGHTIQQDLFNLQGNNNINHQSTDHHHNFIHGHQQQQQQHNLQIEQEQQLFEAHQSDLINEQNNLNSHGQRNYFGESSYDVPLQGNKGYHY